MVALRDSRIVETLPRPERRSPIRHERNRQPRHAGSETGAPFAGPGSHALNLVKPSHSMNRPVRAPGLQAVGRVSRPGVGSWLLCAIRGSWKFLLDRSADLRSGTNATVNRATPGRRPALHLRDRIPTPSTLCRLLIPYLPRVRHEVAARRSRNSRSAAVVGDSAAALTVTRACCGWCCAHSRAPEKSSPNATKFGDTTAMKK